MILTFNRCHVGWRETRLEPYIAQRNPRQLIATLVWLQPSSFQCIHRHSNDSTIVTRDQWESSTIVTYWCNHRHRTFLQLHIATHKLIITPWYLPDDKYDIKALFMKWNMRRNPEIYCTIMAYIETRCNATAPFWRWLHVQPSPGPPRCWLSLWCLVSWINNLPPACWSTFWKSKLKW